MHQVHLNVLASVLTLLALALTCSGLVTGRTITEEDPQIVVVSQETTSQSAVASRLDVVQSSVTSSEVSSDSVSKSSTTSSTSSPSSFPSSSSSSFSSSSSPSPISNSIRRNGSFASHSLGQPSGSPSPTTTPEPDYLNSIDSSILNLNYTFEKQLRIEAIKQDILNRLGMTRVPDVSRINMTVQERRQILRLYKKSVEELHGKKESSLLFDDDQFYANQFHSFTEYGKLPTENSIPLLLLLLLLLLITRSSHLRRAIFSPSKWPA